MRTCLPGAVFAYGWNAIADAVLTLQLQRANFVGWAHGGSFAVGNMFAKLNAAALTQLAVCDTSTFGGPGLVQRHLARYTALRVLDVKCIPKHEPSSVAEAREQGRALHALPDLHALVLRNFTGGLQQAAPVTKAHNNALAAYIVAAAEGWPRLQHLVLTDSLLADAAMHSLCSGVEHMQQLSVLTLHALRVSDEGAAGLAHALPALQQLHALLLQTQLSSTCYRAWRGSRTCACCASAALPWRQPQLSI